MKQGSLKEYLNDSKQDVTNYFQNGKCSNCGNCCTAVLPVTKREIKMIKHYVKIHNIKAKSFYSGFTPLVPWSFDFTCPFRDEENHKCTIYFVRSAVCREFRCNKSKAEIERTKEHFANDNRYTITNLRQMFG